MRATRYAALMHHHLTLHRRAQGQLATGAACSQHVCNTICSSHAASFQIIHLTVHRRARGQLVTGAACSQHVCNTICSSHAASQDSTPSGGSSPTLPVCCQHELSADLHEQGSISRSMCRCTWDPGSALPAPYMVPPTHVVPFLKDHSWLGVMGGLSVAADVLGLWVACSSVRPRRSRLHSLWQCWRACMRRLCGRPWRASTPWATEALPRMASSEPGRCCPCPWSRRSCLGPSR